MSSVSVASNDFFTDRNFTLLSHSQPTENTGILPSDDDDVVQTVFFQLCFLIVSGGVDGAASQRQLSSNLSFISLFVRRKIRFRQPYILRLFFCLVPFFNATA